MTPAAAFSVRGYNYAGNTVESVTSLSMGLLRNILDGRANLRSVAIHNPDLLALFERAAGHHLE